MRERKRQEQGTRPIKAWSAISGLIIYSNKSNAPDCARLLKTSVETVMSQPRDDSDWKRHWMILHEKCKYCTVPLVLVEIKPVPKRFFHVLGGSDFSARSYGRLETRHSSLRLAEQKYQPRPVHKRIFWA